jgi:FAD/FMN-containing dehydrogenase
MKSISMLRSKLKGTVFTPLDAGYSAAKRGKGTTPLHDREPALVTLPEGPGDIARAIEFARSNGMEFCVRCGGHDMLGASTTPAGLLIDLRRMNSVVLDPSSQSVRVGGGARSGAVTAAARRFGLAPVLGMSPNVGIGGLVLGGGVGWISGTHGAAVDHFVAAEIVAADGRLIKVDALNEPELFWAVRGGGGNFGVATSFTLRLQPLGNVMAGELQCEAEPARVMEFMRGFLPESGDGLDMELSFEPANRKFATIRLCWSGDLDAGERALRPLQRFATVTRDAIKVQAFADFANDEPRIDTMFLRGGELDALTIEAADAVAEVIANGGPQGCSIGLLHYMHGALCRPPADTPFPRPSGHLLYNIAATWQGNTADQRKIDWVLATYGRLQKVSSVRTYLNYLCEEGEEPVQSTFGPHFEKLREIKRRVDPNNIFRSNRNIRP